MTTPESDARLADLRARVLHHLEVIYPEFDPGPICDSLLNSMGLQDPLPLISHRNIWDQSDVVLITYADTIGNEHTPLQTLKSFIDEHFREAISTVHILPFYPFSSDDGFAVIDYSSVNESHGTWTDVEAIAKDYKLMADLVINHASARSRWFENFKLNESPGKGYFVTVPADTDVSEVVRPRTSPLLNPVKTVDGEKHVWCTFSPDQVDSVHPPFGWTIRQVFEHCADAERVFGYRMLRLAAGDTTDYWVLSRFADVFAAVRDTGTFSATASACSCAAET